MVKVFNIFIIKLAHQVCRLKVRAYCINILLTTVFTDLKLRFKKKNFKVFVIILKAFF